MSVFDYVFEERKARSLSRRLAHPLHHAKYALFGMTMQFLFFPVEHYIWHHVIGVSF